MLVKQIKFGLRHLRLRHNGLMVEVNVPTFTSGDGGSGEWTVCPAALDSDSIVYSFGVGRNISWDLTMIDRFGVKLHAFDPTPKAIEWVTAQSVPKNFQFHPVGIAAYNGEMEFFPPSSDRSAHFSPIDRGKGSSDDRITAPVKRLASIMRDLNHTRIDVLKLDIEGGEYQVIPDVLASRIPVGQILVEFHHNYRTVTMSQTLMAVHALRVAGYRVFSISRRGLEFSFIRQDR